MKTTIPLILLTLLLILSGGKGQGEQQGKQQMPQVVDSANTKEQVIKMADESQKKTKSILSSILSRRRHRETRYVHDTVTIEKPVLIYIPVIKVIHDTLIIRK